MTCLRQKYWNRHMSKETNLNPQHEEGEFEREDLSPQGIFAFLVGLGLVCVLVLFVLKGMYWYLDMRAKAKQPLPNPLVQPTQADTRAVLPSEINKFPQPRLETNERLEINDVRLKEEKTLNSYGWVDEKAGIVHLPIERAIELVAQRGLPTRPQAGTVPPSPVNVAGEAAKRSDMIGKTGKRSSAKRQ
jgi:hypothetical protein